MIQTLKTSIRILSVVACLTLMATQSADAADRPPNIVLMMADDLGYGDLGSYGQEKIRTPHLDQLASQGMRFTQFYSGSPVCAPSRCTLLTGLHTGHAWIRNNAEVKPEGQPPIPAPTVTLAELLRERGYRCGAFGKWGLGFPGSEGDPLKQGFDRFFGYNCQRHAHSFYPSYLWSDDQRVELRNDPPVPGHAKLPPDADPNDPASYAPYLGKDYSADRITEQALAFIRDNKDRPFFLYYPTTVPHVALHVPKDSLAEYLGKWPDPPYTGDKSYTPHFAPRAAYAAMITRMDRDIGRILALLDELRLAENTIVLFTSDNGPTWVGGVDREFFNSAGGLRGRKNEVYEGGIRVPLIVRFPGRIEPGTESDHVGANWDILPTIMDMIGASAPRTIDGVSFTPTLLGSGQQQEHDVLYWELGPMQAVRSGDWKLVRLFDRRTRQVTVELYNLGDDPTESRNLAAQRPDVLRRMLQLAAESRSPSTLFPSFLDALSDSP